MNPILVTGATGNVGGQVVSQLLSAGVEVRALSRKGGVGVVQGDLTVPESLNDALENVETVFLVWRSPTIDALPALLQRLRKSARRLVFLSSSAVRDGVVQQSNPIGQLHVEIENLIAHSNLEWTFLRPGAFATNTRWWVPQIRQGDVVRWPYGSASTAPIHERDIAAVAVRALLDDGHAGKKYTLTGPAALTQAEQVRILGEATGRHLRLEEISPDTAREQLVAVMPPLIVEILLETWAALTRQPAPVSSTVAEVTGARPHTFRDWAVDHADEFQTKEVGAGAR